ncbi:MAG TPA: LLM class flavin-dependent oxidoreductase [Candidatus Limnocylindrales bacterium]|nr:LLM class flavin-dependent oxidoreductase [Candidatus Limnocylindrales bacterium]
MRISFKTSPQRVDWPTLDATWRLAGEQGGWDGAWMNDHLLGMDPDGAEPSLEAVTTLAALVHHVPGLRVGHGVLSNTFRHPVLLAKAATVLDHATRGNFVLGLGAGWYEREHEPFGIPLPPIGERIDRLISAVEVLTLLFSPEAAAAPGVTRPDPFYPLAGATNVPPPLTQGGPPIFLGGQKPRGIRLAAERAAGWLMPGADAGDLAYLVHRRDALLRALDETGRDPAGFEIVGQVQTGPAAADRARALNEARAMAGAGATEVVVGIPAGLGPAGLEAAHRDVLGPLRAEHG